MPQFPHSVKNKADNQQCQLYIEINCTNLEANQQDQ